MNRNVKHVFLFRFYDYLLDISHETLQLVSYTVMYEKHFENKRNQNATRLHFYVGNLLCAKK